MSGLSLNVMPEFHSGDGIGLSAADGSGVDELRHVAA